MKLKLNELQKIVLNHAASVLEPQGYLFIKSNPPRFQKTENKITSYIEFYFKTHSSFVSFSKMMISHQQVEDIIIEIGTPDNDFETQKKGENFLPTVKDNAILSFDTTYGITTVEQWQQWAESIKNYLQNDGLSFVEKYSHLPVVLQRLSELKLEGKYWHELLGGGPEFFFKGLIISKLCNDPFYNEKVNYVDSLFFPNVTEDWKPYYEKLKTRLETTTAIKII